MKVAVNTRLLLSDKLDGIGWFTFETLRRLVKDHPEVEFHFIFDRPFSSEFIFGKNVVPHVIGPPARHPILMRIWYDTMVPMVLKRINPEIFISTDAQASLTTKFPQLLVIHDINFEHYPMDVPTAFRSYLLNRSIRWAQKVDQIVTVSEFSKQDIVSKYNVPLEKVDVAYNGVNELYAPLSEDEKVAVKRKYTDGKDYFVFVGSIHPRKNLQRLLPAFKLFRERTGSDMKLVIVGNPYWKDQRIREAFDMFRDSNDLVLTGRLAAPDLKDIVGAALSSVYVSYFEGFGIPIVESFKAGVPMITSNVSSMPEVAGDAAVCVDPMNVEEIAEAMIRMAANPEWRATLIDRGLERVKLFNWDQTAEVMWQSIMKVVKHG
jgi:glycosyltransferase involved in cell wall biosynthesis